MTHRFHILVAVDASAAARDAFEQALALSVERDAVLTVAHAVPADQPFNRGGRERNALLSAFERRAEAAGVSVTVDVQHGDPAEIILLHAVARRPDLIVLGTRQRTGASRLRRGSVAERVLLSAPQAVLIVPAASGPAVPSFERLVVGVDFTAASHAGIAHALAAVEPAGRVTLVHALPAHLAARTPLTWRRSVAEAHRRSVTGEAWRRLQETVATAQPRTASVRARVAIGRTSVEIERIAAELEADLIVLGVRRRGAIGRAVLGATAIDVLRSSRRPVLAVPEHAVAATASPRVAPSRLAA